MSRRGKLSELSNDQELRLLLEKFIRKSEELEKRESNVLKHVEMVQSAVASLQTWRESPSAPPVPPALSPPPSSSSLFDPPQQPLRIDVKQIEEETKLIREETEKIQEEIKKKIEENKKLKEAVERRNTLMANRKEIETRTPESSTGSVMAQAPGIEYFSEKLNQLQAQEKKLKRQLELQAEQTRNKEKALEEKIKQLEKDTRIERKLLEGEKKTTNRK